MNPEYKISHYHARCIQGGKGQQESESESSEVFNKGYFQLGSTTDELKSVMGSPNSIDQNPYWSYWYYGKSQVKIVEGKVTGWLDKGNLKLQ